MIHLFKHECIIYGMQGGHGRELNRSVGGKALRYRTGKKQGQNSMLYTISYVWKGQSLMW